MRLRSTILAGWLCALLIAPAAWAATVDSWLVKPSEADPRVSQFDEPNVVLHNRSAPAGAPLVVFLPGTNGKPRNAMVLLKAVSESGFSVIGLEYNDEPAVVQVCPRDPDPACSSDFRRMRTYGDGPSRAVTNSVAELIQTRLARLLIKLDKDHPGQGWGGYLKAGMPDWSRIVVSGLSQGAGMAAWIAQQTPVARVVLFSSPWDFTLPDRALAVWIDGPGATPPDRWYGAYNTREHTADLLARSYARLKIPADHIRVFDLDLPRGFGANSNNPYHPVGIRDPRYTGDWLFLFGRPDATYTSQ